MTKIILVMVIAMVMLAGIAGSAGAQAQPNLQECPKGTTCLIVGLPGVPQQITNPAQYIMGIYRFGLGIGGLFAMVIIVYAGIKRIVSAGNPSAIGEANSMIYSAILGLVLLIGAFLILNTINPRLVELKTPALPKVSTAGAGFAQFGSYAQQISQNLDKINEAQEKFNDSKEQRDNLINELNGQYDLNINGTTPDIRQYPDFASLSKTDQLKLAKANLDYFNNSRDTNDAKLKQAETVYAAMTVATTEEDRRELETAAIAGKCPLGPNLAICQQYNFIINQGVLANLASNNAKKAEKAYQSLNQ